MNNETSIELHICQHCPCNLDSKECMRNRTILTKGKTQGYNCKVLRYRYNRNILGVE